MMTSEALIRHVWEQMVQNFYGHSEIVWSRVPDLPCDEIPDWERAKLPMPPNVEDYPDLYLARRMNTILLIDCVPGRGPIDEPRRVHLMEMFKIKRPCVQCVTVFEDRRAMADVVDRIAWDTKVWIAAEHNCQIQFESAEMAVEMFKRLHGLPGAAPPVERY